MPDNTADNLRQKKCKVCEAGAPPLTKEAIDSYLAVLKDWELIEMAKIKKEFIFNDFKEAMLFVNRIAAVAEEEGHHPLITISYNKVRVTLTTHAIKGLSENDFILAAKIDNLK